jgi:uncharacterized membrane protein HdeD (DUF308 family)
MKSMLAGNWWAFVIRGALAVLFGVLSLFMPGMALLTLVFLFGFYAIAEGLLNIVAAVRRTDPAHRPWWQLTLEGLISIAAGLFALFMPGLGALTLLYIVAAWAIITGALEIAAAIRLRKELRHEWLLGLAGVLSVAFGVIAVFSPGPAALALALWIGVYAIAFGVLLIALGVQLKVRGDEEKRAETGFARPVPIH